MRLDEVIKDINPKPFDLWNELYYAIDRDRNMLDGGKEGWLWIKWALYALAGMAKVNLENIKKI